jgi:hypothetical protein
MTVTLHFTSLLFSSLYDLFINIDLDDVSFSSSSLVWLLYKSVFVIEGAGVRIGWDETSFTRLEWWSSSINIIIEGSDGATCPVRHSYIIYRSIILICMFVWKYRCDWCQRRMTKSLLHMCISMKEKQLYHIKGEQQSIEFVENEILENFTLENTEKLP